MTRAETDRTRSGKRSVSDLGDLDVEDLSPPMADLVHSLLLYKSMFVGPWFTALGQEESGRTREVYASISRETASQAKSTVELIRKWSASAEGGKAEEVKEEVLTWLLQDMLELKKSSTEVFLAAGIRSPTEQLRREFLQLARTDRRHADELRELLGIRIPTEGKETETGTSLGPRIGPFPPGTLSGTIRKALDESKAQGYEASRIVISSIGLRHLRDEGAVESRQGNVFGVPVDVDFSWAGEAFAITSKSRLSLAEIVTEVHGAADAE